MLPPFQSRLEELLAGNIGESKRERLTLMRMYELLRLDGYAGNYDAVRRYAQRWRREQGAVATTYVPLVFAPSGQHRRPDQLLPPR